MSIRDMHYDFKARLNKLDSSQYRNILVPDIDRKLNEAANILVKALAMPKYAKEIGLEVNQRTIDDLRTILIDDSPLVATTVNNIDYFVNLPITTPTEYMYYVSSKVLMNRPSCGNKVCDRVIVRRHDEEHKNSPFNISSFEWREVNIHFINNQIRIFTDGTFSIVKLDLSYIRKMLYMHNAQDYSSGTYTLPNGVVLVGSQDCELPETIHTDVIDLAVLLTTMEINGMDYQLKQAKIQLNQ